MYFSYFIINFKNLTASSSKLRSDHTFKSLAEAGALIAATWASPWDQGDVQSALLRGPNNHQQPQHRPQLSGSSLRRRHCDQIEKMCIFRGGELQSAYN